MKAPFIKGLNIYIFPLFCVKWISYVFYLVCSSYSIANRERKKIKQYAFITVQLLLIFYKAKTRKIMLGIKPENCRKSYCSRFKWMSSIWKIPLKSKTLIPQDRCYIREVFRLLSNRDSLCQWNCVWKYNGTMKHWKCDKMRRWLFIPYSIQKCLSDTASFLRK